MLRDFWEFPGRRPRRRPRDDQNGEVVSGEATPSSPRGARQWMQPVHDLDADEGRRKRDEN